MSDGDDGKLTMMAIMVVVVGGDGVILTLRRSRLCRQLSKSAGSFR